MRACLEFLTSSICSAEDFARKELNCLPGADIDSGILQAAEKVLGQPSALIEVADIVCAGAQCSKSFGRQNICHHPECAAQFGRQLCPGVAIKWTTVT